MSVPRSDELLFAAGGDVWEKYGTFVRRTLPQEERGTFSRSSVATMVDRSGFLREAESGVLRPHYVSSESSYSARLEASRTNDYTRSEDLSHADWAKSNTSVSANAASDPEGGSGVDKVVEDDTAAGSEHSVQQTLPSLSDSTDQTASFYAQEAERRWIAVRTTDQGGTVRTSWIDVQAESAGTTDSGHTVRVLGGEKANGVPRFSVTFPSASGSTTPTVEYLLADADGSVSYDGDGSSGLHLWGMQFEADASFPSSYVATTSSAVSRVADDLTADFPHAPQELTAYVKWVERGTAFETFPKILRIGDGTIRLRVIGTGGPSYRADYRDSTGTQSTIFGIDGSITPEIGKVNEVRVTLKADGSIETEFVKGGSSVTKSGSGADMESSWATDEIGIGGDPNGGSAGFADFISGPIIAPGVRTMDEMRSVEV